MVETRRLKELRGRSTELLRLPDGDLVVALSGGADSATLAYLIRRLGRDVRAVHVDHLTGASARTTTEREEDIPLVGNVLINSSGVRSEPTL